MYARIGDIGDIMMVTFLSVLGTTQYFRGIARYLGCVGRSDLLRALQALKNKSCCCAAGWAPPLRLGHQQR